MPPERRVITVPADLPPVLLDGLLTAAEQTLDHAGALRIWIDTSAPHDVAVMAELPDGSPM